MDTKKLMTSQRYRPISFNTAKTTAETYGLGTDYLAGANIAAFENVANAIAQGIV